MSVSTFFFFFGISVMKLTTTEFKQIGDVFIAVVF